MEYSNFKILQLLCNHPDLDTVGFTHNSNSISQIWLTPNILGFPYLNSKEFALYNSDGINYRIVKIPQDIYEFLKLKLL